MLQELLKLAKELVKKEPVLVGGAVVAAVLAIAGALGIVVDKQSVTSIVGYVITILAGAVTVRSKVTPA